MLTPSGEVEGSGWGGLQAHTRGVSRPTPGGGVLCVSQHAPPKKTVTAAGGTHPVGMHFCFIEIWP